MLSIGMSYETYWYGDTRLIWDYLKAEKLRQEREAYAAWLNGAYVREAILSSIGNAFAKKGQAPNEYPGPPDFSSKEDIVETENQIEEREEQEALWAKVYMDNMVRAGKNWGKKV